MMSQAFFCSNNLIYNNKLLTTIKFVKYIEKNIYFRDVYLFIDRIKNMIVCKNFEFLRNNFYIYLFNIIMYYYIHILIDK